jgi:hypothetical protein
MTQADDLKIWLRTRVRVLELKRLAVTTARIHARLHKRLALPSTELTTPRETLPQAHRERRR